MNSTIIHERVHTYIRAKYAHLDSMDFHMRGSLWGDYREAMDDGIITEDEFKVGEAEFGHFWQRARNN